MILVEITKRVKIDHILVLTNLMSEQQDKVFMYYREKSLYHDNLEGEERQCELCKPI